MVSIEVPNSSDSSVASRITITLLWKREFRNSVIPLPGWRPTFSLNDSSFAISQFKIIMTLVLRFSLLSFKTSGFALCINSLGPKPAIPSILKCLAKLPNALAVWLVLSSMLFLFISFISLISFIFFLTLLLLDWIFDFWYNPWSISQSEHLLDFSDFFSSLFIYFNLRPDREALRAGAVVQHISIMFSQSWTSFESEPFCLCS